MTKEIIITLSLLLAGCASTSPILTQEKLGKINISQELFVCPTIKTFPNPDKLTDVQVGKLIVQLYRNNQRCKTSIDAIEQYIEKHNSIVDSQ